MRARFFLAAVGVLALMASHAAGQEPGGPMTVGIDAVRNEPFRQTTNVLGRLVAREGGVVAARTPGPVQQVLAHVGDRVEEGQVLAVLVKDTLEAQVALQTAEVRIAEQELQRMERLKDSRSAAFQRSRYEDTMQRLAQAQANLRIAEIALANSEIRAPYPGVVTVRHTEAGAYLTAGAPVVTLVNHQSLEIEADVPADQISALSPDSEVGFQVPGVQQDFVAHVRAVVPQENSATRTVAVRFTPTLDNAGFDPRIGQSVNLAIPVGRLRQVVTVQKDAVLSRASGTMVFVVVEGKAQPRPVRLGDAVGNRFVVLQGLEPGERVVVRGNERVRPGQDVRTTRDS